MAISKITYTTKEDRDVTSVPANQKVSAADMNELKTKFNALVDALDGAVRPIRVKITASDFSGSNYDNANAVGLTAETGVQVFTNDGSGTLLNEGAGNGYVFTPALGRFTMDRGNYIIVIYKPIT